MKLITSRSSLFLMMMLLCSGCTTSLISLPEIPKQTCPELPKPKPVVVVEQKQCPSMAMPEPIPKNVTIIVSGGEIVKIDEGGEQLIREYAATRKIIKKLWHDQP